MYYAKTSAEAVNFEPIYQDTKMVLSDEPVKSKLAASSSFWYCCLWRSRSIHLIGRVWPLRTLRRLPVCRKTYKTMMKIFPKEIIPTRWHCSMTVLPILYRNNRDSINLIKLCALWANVLYCTWISCIWGNHAATFTSDKTYSTTWYHMLIKLWNNIRNPWILVELQVKTKLIPH